MSTKLDALVAEKVMGWKLLDRVAMGWGDGPPVHATGDENSPTWQGFAPSEDISAAWRVVEKMNLDGFYSSVECDLVGYVCEFNHCESDKVHWAGDGDASPAICVAALRAVGVPEAEIQEAMR